MSDDGHGHASRRHGPGATARVLIDSVDTPLGQRVLTALGVGPAPLRGSVSGDPATAVTAVVLAAGEPPEVDGTGRGHLDVEAAVALLDNCPALEHVVVVGSAMIYGARPENPNPIPEDTPTRPTPGCRFAEAAARLEAEVARLAVERPRLEVCVLRPVLCVSGEPWSRAWLRRSLWTGDRVRIGDRDPALQFLHLDDLASAVVHAHRRRLVGTFNVAPDGALTRGTQRRLTGAIGPTLRIPPTAAAIGARVAWSLGAVSTPPDALAYSTDAWVVANDRLRATDWSPRWANDEAFVVSHPEHWWASLDAGRRQAVALGGAGAALVVGVCGAWVAVSRRVRLGRTRRRGARPAPQ